MRTQDKKQPAFNDLDPMPFGKHKGEPMQDVPARYLSWLWNQDDFKKQYCKNLSEEDQKKYPVWIIEKIKLANYIWNSRDSLNAEQHEFDL